MSITTKQRLNALALLVKDAEESNEIIVIWPDGRGSGRYSTLPDDLRRLLWSVFDLGRPSELR